jgi:hypothetical protein
MNLPFTFISFLFCFKSTFSILEKIAIFLTQAYFT